MEHLVLVIEKMLSLLKPVIELRLFEVSTVSFIRLGFLDELSVSFDFANKSIVGISVDPVDLTVHDSDTLFVVSSHALQQLKELSLRHARGQDNQTYSKSIL
jgi:hypothetical protein